MLYIYIQIIEQQLWHVYMYVAKHRPAPAAYSPRQESINRREAQEEDRLSNTPAG